MILPKKGIPGGLAADQLSQNAAYPSFGRVIASNNENSSITFDGRDFYELKGIITLSSLPPIQRSNSLLLVVLTHV